MNCYNFRLCRKVIEPFLSIWKKTLITCKPKAWFSSWLFSGLALSWNSWSLEAKLFSPLRFRLLAPTYGEKSSFCRRGPALDGNWKFKFWQDVNPVAPYTSFNSCIYLYFGMRNLYPINLNLLQENKIGWLCWKKYDVYLER